MPQLPWFVIAMLLAPLAVILCAAVYKSLQVRAAREWLPTPGKVVVSASQVREVSFLELGPAQGDQGGLVVRRVLRRDPPGAVAQLAVGAGDQHGADALVGVPGQDPSRPGGFVVGMGVHRHEGERSIGHAVQRTGDGRRPEPARARPDRFSPRSATRRPRR